VHYLALILGVVKLLAALDVQYQVARVLAAWCEGMLLSCVMRWLVFRDGMGPGRLDPFRRSRGERCG
jgi:drug/metabolite transporter superfamily protein YnfA